MSKKAYSVWDNPSNTKPSPAPPAKSKKKQKQTVGVPQGQQSKTPAQKTLPKAESSIPMDRQLYREVLEAQNAVPQHPESKTPKQFVEKPLDRQEQGNLELLNANSRSPCRSRSRLSRRKNKPYPGRSRHFRNGTKNARTHYEKRMKVMRPRRKDAKENWRKKSADARNAKRWKKKPSGCGRKLN